jgi:predicted ester cyclase
MDAVIPSPTRFDQDSAREWFERFVAGWNSHEPERLLELATEDVAWEDPLIVPGGRLDGREALREWVESVWRAFPDLTFEWNGQPFVSADGTQVAAPWSCVGHMTGPLDPPGFAPTGGRVAATGVDIHEFREELLSHVRTTTDVHAWAVQMGAAPPPGSAGERLGAALQRLTARGIRRKNRGA